MTNTDRLVAFNTLTAPFRVTFVARKGDRADEVRLGFEADRVSAAAALKARAAEYRASSRTPDGYRRGDAVLAMYFELASNRVRVAV